MGDGEDPAQAVLDGAAAAGSVTTGILADKLDLIKELKAEGVVVFCCSILNSLVLFRSLKLSYIWSLTIRIVIIILKCVKSGVFVF